jgi:hypothetical protein
MGGGALTSPMVPWAGPPWMSVPCEYRAQLCRYSLSVDVTKSYLDHSARDDRLASPAPALAPRGSAPALNVGQGSVEAAPRLHTTWSRQSVGASRSAVTQRAHR